MAGASVHTARREECCEQTHGQRDLALRGHVKIAPQFWLVIEHQHALHGPPVSPAAFLFPASACPWQAFAFCMSGGIRGPCRRCAPRISWPVRTLRRRFWKQATMRLRRAAGCSSPFHTAHQSAFNLRGSLSAIAFGDQGVVAYKPSVPRYRLPPEQLMSLRSLAFCGTVRKSSQSFAILSVIRRALRSVVVPACPGDSACRRSCDSDHARAGDPVLSWPGPPIIACRQLLLDSRPCL